MAPVSRPPILDVLDEHCEELGFLGVQRRALPFSPDAKLRHLAAAEQRISAHKAALAVGGRAAVSRARARLAKVERTTRDPFQWSAAVEVVVERAAGDEAAAWARLVSAPADFVDAFSEALRRAEPAAFRRMLDRRGVLVGEPRVLAAAADAVAFRRGLTPADELPGLELVEVRRARARGLGAGPEADDAAVLAALDDLLDDDDPSVRRAALWSSALRDPARAAAVARGRLRDPFAVRVLGLTGAPSDLDALVEALVPMTTRNAALDAIGDLGHPGAGTLLSGIAARAESWSERAARALEKLAGPGPAEHRDCHSSTMRAQVARLAEAPGGQRILRGAPLDRVGSESSLEALWTAAVTSRAAAAHPVLAALRREVPSGFFTGQSFEDASPGDGPWS